MRMVCIIFWKLILLFRVIHSNVITIHGHLIITMFYVLGAASLLKEELFKFARLKGRKHTSRHAFFFSYLEDFIGLINGLTRLMGSGEKEG